MLRLNAGYTMSSSHKPASQKNLFLVHLGALLAVSVWGTSFVCTKVLLDNGLHAVEIYLYRFFVAYLLVLCVSHKQLFAKSLRDELLLAVCGLCGGAIYFIAENTALKYTLTSNVSLITTLAPLLTTLLIGLLYKNERPNAWVYIGSVIALTGVVCIVFKEGFNLKVMPLGDMLALSAAFAWAIYAVVLRKINATYNAWFITRKTFFYGLLTATPFLIVEPEICPPSVLLNPVVMGNLLFLGIVASMLCYYIWAQSVNRLGAIKASNYLYIQPIVTMIFSAIAFDNDPITAMGCAGCVLIIGGVWFGDYMTHNKN